MHVKPTIPILATELVPNFAKDHAVGLSVPTLQREILRTLLYYDIWQYPLKAEEIYAFLPVNSLTYPEFRRQLRDATDGRTIFEKGGYYFVRGTTEKVVELRHSREAHARLMWRRARVAMHVIKRFPFVRAVFVSGDLSKNATTRKSDVDFFLITEPNRLWIARSLLILFKKTLLLNKKKYFCLNYFASSDHLELDEHNIFQATEVAQLKPLFNGTMFQAYIRANSWIEQFFPNFDVGKLPMEKINEHPSIVQRLLEIPFRFLPADALDRRIQKYMVGVWQRRYPKYDDATREKIFRCSRRESRAYVGDFETKILCTYHQRLKEFEVST